uniref:Uncharacterized protein n=1 Tax=Anguilla anguilla TaxID=7936 RepID=A0A0E9XWV7_ANGAN
MFKCWMGIQVFQHYQSMRNNTLKKAIQWRARTRTHKHHSHQSLFIFI